VGAPKAFQIMVCYLPGRRPSFGRTKDDHRPAWSRCLAGASGLFLVFTDVGNALFHRGSHGLVHGLNIVAFDKVGSPAVAMEKVLKFLVADASKDCWVVDLGTCQCLESYRENK